MQTVLIVDDHAGFRSQARRLLNAAGFEVVGEAGTGGAAVESARRLRPAEGAQADFRRQRLQPRLLAGRRPDRVRAPLRRRDAGRDRHDGRRRLVSARVTTACIADPCLGDNSPAWSPDGSRLVFERAFGPIVKDAAAGLDLVTANADGSSEELILHLRSLEAEGKEPHDAQWSSDGTRIAVNILNIKAKPRNGSAIYVLDADGSDLRRITPTRLNAGSPDWSPDGKRIAFNSSYEGQAAVEIYTARPDGSGLKRLRKEPEGSFSFEPSWSPNGKRLAFVHATQKQLPHIWTMKRNGKACARSHAGPSPTQAGLGVASRLAAGSRATLRPLRGGPDS